MSCVDVHVYVHVHVHVYFFFFFRSKEKKIRSLFSHGLGVCAEKGKVAAKRNMVGRILRRW